MTDITASRAIRGLLVFQIVAGAALVAADVSGSFRGFDWRGPEAPAFDSPVRPGDQRRLYDPARLPAAPGDPGQREARPVLEFGPRLTFRETGERMEVEGEIAPGDAARLREILARSGPPRLVTLNSPGGSVSEALDIGRQLRDAGVSTHVDVSAVCLSACPYIFAGGTERAAPSGARIGVHQHYFGESTVLPAFLAVEDVQRGQGLVMAYLDEMGVDPLIMTHALTTPPDEIYILIGEELDRYALRTSAE